MLKAYFTVQIQKVKGEQAHPYSDIFYFDVLALPFTQLLEGEYFASDRIPCNSLSIQYK